MVKAFRQFIARGNVIDLAVAVIVGGAFGKITTSLVEGVLMPPLGLAIGRVDVSSLFYTLDRSQGIPLSLAEAKAKGIPVMAVGAFVNDVINFLVVAFVVFLVIKALNTVKRQDQAPPVQPTTRDCPRCLSAVPLRATRCAHCTSELQAGVPGGM